MNYQKFADALGLKLEVTRLQEYNEYSVEGPTDKVLSFRNLVPAYGTGWYDLDDNTSAYIFIG